MPERAGGSEAAPVGATPGARPIGFVGVGAMGGPMLDRLRAAGHPVRVWVRSPDRADALEAAGVSVCATPRELAAACEAVLGCLPGDAAVEAVYGGPDGLLAGAAPGLALVEHGTISAQLARRLAAAAAQRGAAFVDAPVSGGPDGAAAGRLVVMAGGSAEDVERVAPYVGAYARDLVCVGPAGACSELKLVNQLLVTSHLAAAAEAAALLERLGLSPEPAARVLNAGWAGGVMLERTLSRLRDDALEGDGATLGRLGAVQPLVRDLCEQAGVAASLHARAVELLAAAVSDGFADRDLAALARSPGVRGGDA